MADPAGNHQPQTRPDAGKRNLSFTHRQRVWPQARTSHFYLFYPLRFHITRHGQIHLLATKISHHQRWNNAAGAAAAMNFVLTD
jgi:hypothetical protein